ncbi:MAG: hypothetical protein HZB23_15470 [Deltaproteobacteria bacterium]|nr:hypothetical protein [Deltaproteobacteria bacterium]
MALKITFHKTGANSESALIGDLTLFNGTKVVHTVTAFSGGNGNHPLDDGNYRIHLDIRGDEGTAVCDNEGALKPYYGIQNLPEEIANCNGTTGYPRLEWGSIRARLNPQSGTDHGYYLHGKERAGDWTHGCVCDRSGKIMNYLWNLDKPPRSVDVIVTGGKQFPIEELVKKNLIIVK